MKTLKQQLQELLDENKKKPVANTKFYQEINDLILKWTIDLKPHSERTINGRLEELAQEGTQRSNQ